MKEIFKCEECNEEFTRPENLGKHVKYHNMLREEYYNKWNKQNEKEGTCEICGNLTNFLGVLSGYSKYCSLECKRIGAGQKTAETFKKKREKIKQTYKFQCEECKEKFKTSIKLNNHIIKVHGIKEYYDKHLKKENESKCKICNNETNFTRKLFGKYSGYEMCCSKECREKYRLKKRTQTNLKKYGVKNPFESEIVKEKIKQTFIKHYGVDNNMKSIKGRKAYKKSMKRKYGVEWPLQNKSILEKNQKSAKTLKQYKDTTLWYQGTYEKEFLDLYLEKYPDIERGPSIKYKFNGKNKIYHPDFYIPSKNLIIEIKSSWTLNIDLEIKEKKKATIANGFKYIMILDKNYQNFNSK